MTAAYDKIFNSYNGVGLTSDVPVFGGTAAPATEFSGQTLPQGAVYFRNNGEVYRKTGTGQTAGDWTLAIQADGKASDAELLDGLDSTQFARTDIAETFDDNVIIQGTLDVNTHIDVDNLRLDGNTLSSSNTNGNITLAPNGTGDVVIEADLIVNGTTTQVNTEQVTIDDNIIVLNNNETGTPSQDSGIEVERGTSTNARLLWDESADRWAVDQGTGVLTNILTVADEGSGNGIDADTLDGVDSLQFVRSDQNDSLVGNYDITGLLDVDNLRLDLNALTSTNTNGDINITPNGTGDIVLDGQKWPQAGGSVDQVLRINGAGQTNWQTLDLDYLDDVVITSPDPDQVLAYNGTNWVNVDPDSAQITADAVTTETTVDSVVVDNIIAVKWSIACYETGTNNVDFVELRAIHNGITGDATVTDQAQYSQLQTGTGVTGLSINVDLNGTGGTQTLRLRVSATNATNVRATRERINL